MTQDAGVLLVRRIRPWVEKLTTRARNAAIEMSEEDVARSYRGIDGTPWPEELASSVPHSSGLAPIDRWPEILRTASDRSGEYIYDAVILARRPSLSTHIVTGEFLGFDFGYYDDEYSVFSSIYNEAIHSPLTDLRRYASRLNESLLLPTPADVNAYRETRERLRLAGSDVEGGDCYPIAVFGERRS
jgi:hypothetical protein